jgi:hypothetical protein
LFIALTMNTQFEMTVPYQHQTVEGCSGYGYGYRSSNTREVSLLSESLFGIAYDMDHSLGLQQQDLEPPLPAYTQTAFYYPVDEDEYKGVSLREILELSDNYLFEDMENNNMRNSSMLNPIPLNVPCGQNVASHAAALATSQAYTEPVASVQKENPIQLTIDDIEPTPINVWPVFMMMPTDCQSPTKRKRPREEPTLVDESDEDGPLCPSRAGQWTERFSSLCLYRKKHRNCLVPNTYKDDRSLPRWIKRQRYEYKLMIEGKPSTITDERVKALEEIDFVWNLHAASWGEHLENLKEFRSIYLHSNVPRNSRENPQLAIWVKSQRRQYKLRMEGKASHMTPQRIRDLEAVGFEWLRRSYKKPRTM